MSENVRGIVALNSLAKVTNQDELVANLESQVSEVEMLEAMFANPGEFVMDEPKALDDCRIWLSAASANKDMGFVPPTLSFRIQLAVGGSHEGTAFIFVLVSGGFKRLFYNITLESQCA